METLNNKSIIELNEALTTANRSLTFLPALPHTLSRITYWETQKRLVTMELNRRTI